MLALLLGFGFDATGVQLAFQFALLLVTQGAYLTKQISYLFLGLGLHGGYRVQEKGWGVKYGLPLSDRALLSSHAEFSLCGAAALLAATCPAEGCGVP